MDMDDFSLYRKFLGNLHEAVSSDLKPLVETIIYQFESIANPLADEIIRNPGNFYFRGFDAPDMKTEIKDFFAHNGTDAAKWLWISPYFDTACKYAANYRTGKIAVIEIDDEKLKPIPLTELEYICDPIDAAGYAKEITEAGYNAAYNYLDSEEGICIFDPGIVKRIQILDPETIKLLYDHFEVGDDAEPYIEEWKNSI